MVEPTMTDIMREAYAAGIVRLGAETSITIRFTREKMTVKGITTILHRLHGKIDRVLLGPRYNKNPNRSRYWGIVEKIDYSAHCHLGYKLPNGQNIDDLKRAFAAIDLKKLGIMDEYVINPKPNSGWEIYCVKSLITADHCILP